MRKDWVDVAKGIAIIAIVIWHTKYNYPDISWLPIKVLMAGIWPVPVFFMIAGFFLTNDKLTNTKKFIVKKVKTLYWPTVWLYIIATFLHNWFIRINFYDITMDYDGFVTAYTTTDFIKWFIADFFLAGKELILAPMWFVCVLFVALCMMSVETTVINRFTKTKRQFRISQLLIFLIPALVYTVISNVYQIEIPRYQQTFSAIWLIFVGMLMNQYKKLTYSNTYLFLICLMIIYIFSVLCENIKEDIISYTICTTAACYALCYISKCISHHCRYLNILLAFVGRDSFYIMALHLIGFKVCTLILNLLGQQQDLAMLIAPTNDNLLLYICYVFCGTFIPLLAIYLFRNIKKLLTQKKNAGA